MLGGIPQQPLWLLSLQVVFVGLSVGPVYIPSILQKVFIRGTAWQATKTGRRSQRSSSSIHECIEVLASQWAGLVSSMLFSSQPLNLRRNASTGWKSMRTLSAQLRLRELLLAHVSWHWRGVLGRRFCILASPLRKASNRIRSSWNSQAPANRMDSRISCYS